MSELVALFAPGADGLREAEAFPAGTLGADERPTAWCHPNAALHAASHGWEERLSGASLYVTPELIVAADASLYRREELARALAAEGVTAGGMAAGGIAAGGDGAAALLAAAYQAWGDRAAGRLEGDFAFVVLDRVRRRVVAARDPIGRRALHFAHAGGRLVVASTPDAVVARLPGPRRLNLAHLAGRAAGLLEAWDSAYEGVAPLPAGHTLVAELRADGTAGVPELRRQWMAPTFEQPGEPFAAAADRLRALLERAVAERLDPAAPTAVWLSGGYDSTAVYGAGQAALRAGSPGGPVLAVSMSYPPGDAGREDELIEAAARFWGGGVEWRQVDDAPLFGDAAEGARRRAGPFAHAFEQWMATLARAAVDVGARVVLDGSGGDQLFQVSPVFLADLVRSGRWRAARDQWRAMGLGGAGWRRFARAGVLPLLPDGALRLAGLLRGGRSIRGVRAGIVPAWIRPERRGELMARLELRLPRRRGESESARESRWYFETSYSAAVFAEQRAIARRAGVEVRSPLLDRRIVELAATRPREERAGGGETKRLLRQASRGLLPEGLLATRRSRTGTTSHYYRRALLRELPAVAASVLEGSVLAALDVLEPTAFRSAVERYRRGGDAELGAALFATAQAEFWIRARV